MKKEKWLLKEIDDWQRQEIINEETVILLRQKYSSKQNTNFLIIVFSIIGALLIGSGIILIGAKNWYTLPIFIRVACAFLPLLISQALSIYVLKFKYESTAWREAVAILVTASVFTAVAMVGQIFHLAGDYGTYVLTCGLLSLPIIYLLNASAPLLIYYWAILNWGALTEAASNAPILFGLFMLGALFVFLKRKEVNARLTYMTWITLFAGMIATWIIGWQLNGSLLLALLLYFALLLSIDGLPDFLRLPFEFIGTLGTFIILFIFTYRDTWAWAYTDSATMLGFAIMTGIILLSILAFSFRMFETDRLKFLFIISLMLICIMRYLWLMIGLDDWPYEFIFMIISNVLMLLFGIGYIARGTKRISLLTTNIGMAVICALIIMRFFDSNMDIFWRGIVFLVIGTAFLLANLRILKVKKQHMQGVEQ